MVKKDLPTFDKLPTFHGFTGCAWDVWGKDDQLGTINLLTEEVVAEAAKEIKTGKTVCLNWPVNFPGKPMFDRQSPTINSWMQTPFINDDSISMNTQSGSQWDGLKHYGVAGANVFYNNTPSSFFFRGAHGAKVAGPDGIDNTSPYTKLGIHNWAQHGICGRGVFLDLVNFFTEGGRKPLPYDPWTTHAITAQDLENCAKKQGITFHQGDVLLLRVGWMQRWYAATQAERDALATKDETAAGIEQSEDMKAFLWNNHFAAIASDQPSLERWPDPVRPPRMHQTLIALFGMPIGELFDLEKLSKTCAETGRYTFFFTSWPLNVIGGVASPPNAAAYF